MYPQVKLKKEWIQDGISDETVNWSKSFGEFLQSNARGTGPLTSSQIRKFYGELKRIQSDPIKFSADIPLLKAKLAYAVGREAKNNRGQISYSTKLKELFDELEKGIDYIRKDENNIKHDTINFVKIVESIVAYHKFFGGK